MEDATTSRSAVQLGRSSGEQLQLTGATSANPVRCNDTQPVEGKKPDVQIE
jgi:hypothetical protein